MCICVRACSHVQTHIQPRLIRADTMLTHDDPPNWPKGVKQDSG